jgi:hypothetical protein
MSVLAVVVAQSVPAEAAPKSVEDLLPPRIGLAERQPMPEGRGRFDGPGGMWVEARYQVAGDEGDSRPRALVLNLVHLIDPVAAKTDYFVVRKPGQTLDRNGATFEGVKVDGRFVQRRHDQSGATGDVRLLLAGRVLLILAIERPIDRDEAARWLRQISGALAQTDSAREARGLRPQTFEPRARSEAEGRDPVGLAEWAAPVEAIRRRPGDERPAGWRRPPTGNACAGEASFWIRFERLDLSSRRFRMRLRASVRARSPRGARRPLADQP